MPHSNEVMCITQIPSTDGFATEAGVIGVRRRCQPILNLLNDCWSYAILPAALSWGEQVEVSGSIVMALAEVPRMDRLATEALIKCHCWLCQALTHGFHDRLWGWAFLVVIRMADVGVLAYCRKQLQVLNAVVVAVAVDVMHCLFGQQGAAQVLLHDKAMFKHRMTIDAHSDIARLSLSRHQLCGACASPANVVLMTPSMSHSWLVASFDRAYRHLSLLLYEIGQSIH